MHGLCINQRHRHGWLRFVQMLFWQLGDRRHRFLYRCRVLNWHDSSSCRNFWTAAVVPHDDAQLVFFFVIDKQLARHIALVAEHVDEKAHGTQAGAQLFENLILISLADFAQHQALDGVAHALHGGRCLVKAQHQQHTTHLRHLAWHRRQHRGICRVAEELVQLLFALSQGHPQLANDRTHGLLVAGLAIQLFHPGLKWLGGRAIQGRF